MKTTKIPMTATRTARLVKYLRKNKTSSIASLLIEGLKNLRKGKMSLTHRV